MRISSGDLVVGSKRAYESVTGSAKLQQDLELWLLEKVGTDPSTPTYGSSLDGGVIGGETFPSFIGQSTTQARIREIESEIRRVLELYQETQLTKMQSEMAQFRGKHTLGADEVLVSIDSIEAAVQGDLVIVKVGVSTPVTTLSLIIPAQV